ncbi:MAG: hypothetical protein ACRC62_15640 [Microcoleus sp.]
MNIYPYPVIPTVKECATPEDLQTLEQSLRVAIDNLFVESETNPDLNNSFWRLWLKNEPQNDGTRNLCVSVPILSLQSSLEIFCTPITPPPPDHEDDSTDNGDGTFTYAFAEGVTFTYRPTPTGQSGNLTTWNSLAWNPTGLVVSARYDALDSAGVSVGNSNVNYTNSMTGDIFSFHKFANAVKVKLTVTLNDARVLTYTYPFL